MMKDSLKKKREDFHVSIRRERIETIFQERRLLRKQELFCEEVKQLQCMFETASKRRLWIEHKGRQLTGMPDKSWESIMRQLLKASSYFRDEFESWISLGIIASICELVRFENVDVGLCEVATELLSLTLYHESDQRSQESVNHAKTTKTPLATEIADQNILEDLAGHLRNEEAPLFQGFSHLTLISNLTTMGEKNKIKNSGCFQAAVAWSLRAVANSCPFSFLEHALFFFQNFNFVSSSLDVNITRCTLSIFSKFLTLNTNEGFRLEVLRQITSMFQKSAHIVSQQIVFSKQLLSTIVNELCGESQSCRNTCWFLMSQLSSSDKISMEDICEDFDLIGMAERFLMTEWKDKQKLDKTLELIVLTLSNAVLDSDAVTHEILHNKNIMIHVLDLFHQSRPLKLQKGSCFFISCLSESRHINFHEKLVMEYQVLDSLLKQLSRNYDYCADLTIEILRTLRNFINKAHEVYTGKENFILTVLNTNYNFQSLLVAITESVKNHMVTTLTNELLDMYSQVV